MNDHSKHSRQKHSAEDLASDEEIVLLAEGELRLDEKEAVLEKIEAGDDWKRVAIALLQTQALHKGFSSVTTNVDFQKNSNEPDIRRGKSVTRAEGPARSSLSLWKLTICLGCVFLLGGIVGRWVGSPQQIVDAQGTFEEKEKRVSNPATSNSKTLNPKTTGDPQILTEVYQAVDSLGVKDSELIAFVNIEHESQRKVFPLIRSPLLARQIQLTTNPDLPENVESHMRKSGWQVQSTKQFVSINLPNGKSKVFPIGMLNYKFVGNPVF